MESWPRVRQHFCTLFFRVPNSSSDLQASFVTYGHANLRFVIYLGCTLIAIPFHVLKVCFVWTFAHFDCRESDLGKNWSCKFLVNFLICSRACWPPSFIRRFLQASPCSATLLTLSLELSKGELFSFFPFLLHGWNHLCNSDVLVSIMPPTLPYISKHSHPLHGWCL